MEINILGQNYKVIELEHIDQHDGITTMGQINYLKNEIYILSNLTPERKEHTLWHEIVHGILDAQGYTEQSDNEKLINALATGIQNVLNNNDKLDWIYKEEVK